MIEAALIKQVVQQEGFDACGIAQASAVDANNGQAFEAWLQRDFHAQMSYMARSPEKRTDPRTWVENLQSWVVMLWQYKPQQWQDEHLPQIACYAYGQDYHQFLKAKLQRILQNLQHHHNSLHGRGFVDTAPILERYWARQAGLGFIGKNSMLIHPQLGSFTFIALLALSKQVNCYDQPLSQNDCGSCQKCIAACPTHAIVAPRVVNANRCVSYLTIEKPHYTQNRLAEQRQHVCKNCNYVFGCDLCQRVCPYNKKAVAGVHQDWPINRKLLQMSRQDWLSLDEAQFETLAQHSPLQRAGCAGIKNNL